MPLGQGGVGHVGTIGRVLQDVPPVLQVGGVQGTKDPVSVGNPLLDPPHSHVHQHVQGQVQAEGEVQETDGGRRGIKECI